VPPPPEAVFQPANVYPERVNVLEVRAIEALETCVDIEPDPPLESNVTAKVGVQRMMTVPEPPSPPSLRRVLQKPAPPPPPPVFAEPFTPVDVVADDEDAIPPAPPPPEPPAPAVAP